MRPSLVIAFLIAAAGWAGLAVSSHRASRLSERVDVLEREVREKSVEMERVRQQLLSSQEKLRSSARTVARLQEEAERAREGTGTRGAPGEPSAGGGDGPTQPAEVGGKTGKGPGNPMARMSQAMLKAPAMRKMMKEQLGRNYAEIFKELGFDEETRKVIEEALLDQNLFDQQLQLLLLDESVPEQEIVRQQVETAGRIEGILQQRMTPAQWERWQGFEREGAQKAQDGLRKYHEAVLQLRPDQSTARDLLAREQEAIQSEFGPIAQRSSDRLRRIGLDDIRKFRSQLQDTAALVKQVADRHREMNERLRPLLTEEQFQQLIKMQEQERDGMELSLQMLQAMREE